MCNELSDAFSSFFDSAFIRTAVSIVKLVCTIPGTFSTTMKPFGRSRHALPRRVDQLLVRVRPDPADAQPRRDKLWRVDYSNPFPY